MSEMDEYADHEVQQTGIRIDVYSDEQNTDVGTEDAAVVPVSDRGIDSDELAELVGMYRTATLFTVDEADEQQEFVGDSTGEYNFGINLTGKEELPTDMFTNATSSREVDDDEIGDAGRALVVNENDPGILDNGSLSVTSGLLPGVNAVVTDTPAGAGAGSGGSTEERFINFRDEFGTGPFLDRTDDLNFGAEIGHNNVNGRSQLEVRYTLYWAVHSMPEGRSSFARP